MYYCNTVQQPVGSISKQDKQQSDSSSVISCVFSKVVVEEVVDADVVFATGATCTSLGSSGFTCSFFSSIFCKQNNILW